MTRQVALYGFVRYRDGLRVRPIGVGHSRCYLFYAGGASAAVISTVPSYSFEPSLSNMVSHDEVIEKIYRHQTILPARFPKLLSLKALEKSMSLMDDDISKALGKMLFKSEFRVKFLLAEERSWQDPSTRYFNALSKFFIENSSDSRYRHYFPILTQEAKEAEFMHYTETVIRHVSQRLSRFASYWRVRSFESETVFLDFFFWVRKSRKDPFLRDVDSLRRFFPNLRLNVLGPYPPFNFVNIDFQKSSI